MYNIILLATINDKLPFAYIFTSIHYNRINSRRIITIKFSCIFYFIFFFNQFDEFPSPMAENDQVKNRKTLKGELL